MLEQELPSTFGLKERQGVRLRQLSPSGKGVGLEQSPAQVSFDPLITAHPPMLCMLVCLDRLGRQPIHQESGQKAHDSVQMVSQNVPFHGRQGKILEHLLSFAMPLGL